MLIDVGKEQNDDHVMVPSFPELGDFLESAGSAALPTVVLHRTHLLHPRVGRSGLCWSSVPAAVRQELQDRRGGLRETHSRRPPPPWKGEAWKSNIIVYHPMERLLQI